MVAEAWVTTGVPSPKSKLYEPIVSLLSGSLELAPLKFTCSGAVPEVGDPVSTASGAVFGRHESLPTITYSPVGVRLSGQLSGVIPTGVVALIRKALRTCPTAGLPTPLRGTTTVIVPF